MPDWRQGKPYRPNVGICLINRDGLVWAGKGEKPEGGVYEPGCEWEMPQGGIEESEDIVTAAVRELWEETGVSSVELLSQTNTWWIYEFPESAEINFQKLTAFRGQKQKWVALRFLGEDSEVNISADHTQEPQEYFDWQWVTASDLLDQTVSFKVAQYTRVFDEFSEFLT